MEGRRSRTQATVTSGTKLKQTFSRNILTGNYINKKGNVSMDTTKKHRVRRTKGEMKVKNLDREEQKILGYNTSLIQDIMEKTGRIPWSKENEKIEDHQHNEHIHH